MPAPLNKYSSRITQPKSQGASQAMLYGTGLTDDDMNKAAGRHRQRLVRGQHLQHAPQRRWPTKVKEGVQAAGLVGMRFNTIGVSDGISMGTEGMSYSLQSRDLIADSIETVMGAQWYDANIALPGCDKNMPGCLMAMGRAQPPGAHGLRRHDQAGLHADGENARHRLGLSVLRRVPRRQDRRRRARRRSSATAAPARAPAAACTRPTRWPRRSRRWACRCPTARRFRPRTRTSSTNASRPARRSASCLERDLKPRDIMTRAAFENAMVVVMALGGSTNAVLHLIAMARAVDVPLTIDDFQKVSDRVPFLADLKPSGKYVQEDLHDVGGTPAVMKYLLEKGLLDGDCLTVTGKTLAENLRRPAGLEARARRSSIRSKSRSRRRATSGSCAATSRPRAPSPRSPARKGCGSAARPSVYDSRRRHAARRWSGRRSRRAT